MGTSFRFYIGGAEGGERRLANFRKKANELFKGNMSKMINFAINHAFGMDEETGDPRPNAPKYEIVPESLAIVNDAPSNRKRKKQKL